MLTTGILNDDNDDDGDDEGLFNFFTESLFSIELANYNQNMIELQFKN